jgi:hypothetical protein
VASTVAMIRQPHWVLCRENRKKFEEIEHDQQWLRRNRPVRMSRDEIVDRADGRQEV